MPEFSTIWPVITLFLGAAATLGRDVITQSRQEHREEEVRRRELAKTNLERREQFELEHLVAINSLLRAHSDAVLDLSIALRAHRRAQAAGEPSTYPQDAVNRVHSADAAVWAKSGLILADPVRAWVQAAHESARTTSATVQAGDREPELNVMRDKLNGAYTAVSNRVREIYEGRAMAAS